MHYAVIARCPVTDGKVVSFDDTEAKKIKGVKQVFAIESQPYDPLWTDDWREFYAGVQSGVAVVADCTWAALKGRQALKIEWDFGKKTNQSTSKLEALMAKKTRESHFVTQTFGKPLEKIRKSKQTIQQTYQIPYLPHLLMEPLGAVAKVQNNQCEIWTGTQDPAFNAEYLAKVLKIPQKNVTVHWMPSGGGFGRRYDQDFVAEAALVAQKAKWPIKLMWTREDDIQHGHHQSMRQEVYNAALNEVDKKMEAIHYKAIVTDTGNHGRYAPGLCTNIVCLIFGQSIIGE